MEVAINETNNVSSVIGDYGINVYWVKQKDSSSTYELTAETVFDFWYSECQYHNNPGVYVYPEEISKFSFLINFLI